MGIRGEIYSTKVSLENRTYFFNVKENRLGDLYLNIVESKNKDTGGFDRQSLVLFADDLQEFLKGFDDSLKIMEKTVREKRKPFPASRGERSYSEERGRPSASDREERGDAGDRKPFDRDRKPFDRERKPFDQERKPFDRDRKPFGQDRKPFDRDRKPFGQDRKPFDRDRKPFDRDRKPFDRDRKPFDRGATPFHADHSGGRDERPFDRDKRPFDKNRKPFDRPAPGAGERPFKKFIKTGGGHKRAGASGAKKGQRKARAVKAVRRDEAGED